MYDDPSSKETDSKEVHLAKCRVDRFSMLGLERSNSARQLSLFLQQCIDIRFQLALSCDRSLVVILLVLPCGAT